MEMKPKANNSFLWLWSFQFLGRVFKRHAGAPECATERKLSEDLPHLHFD